MVSFIIELIERNCDHEEEPKPTFYQYYEKMKVRESLGFEETLVLVEEYARLHHTVIPEYFVSVVEVYQDQD
jgi:hypothetical protein